MCLESGLLPRQIILEDKGERRFNRLGGRTISVLALEAESQYPIRGFNLRNVAVRLE
jgi:hypothetical protein